MLTLAEVGTSSAWERAFEELKMLEMDGSSVVRGEVNESFSRIKKSGHVAEGNR